MATRIGKINFTNKVVLIKLYELIYFNWKQAMESHDVLFILYEALLSSFKNQQSA